MHKFKELQNIWRPLSEKPVAHTHALVSIGVWIENEIDSTKQDYHHLYFTLMTYQVKMKLPTRKSKDSDFAQAQPYIEYDGEWSAYPLSGEALHITKVKIEQSSGFWMELRTPVATRNRPNDGE